MAKLQWEVKQAVEVIAAMNEEQKGQRMPPVVCTVIALIDPAEIMAMLRHEGYGTLPPLAP